MAELESGGGGGGGGRGGGRQGDSSGNQYRWQVQLFLKVRVAKGETKTVVPSLSRRNTT